MEKILEKISELVILMAEQSLETLKNDDARDFQKMIEGLADWVNEYFTEDEREKLAMLTTIMLAEKLKK